MEMLLLDGADRKKVFPSLVERGLVKEKGEESDSEEEEEPVKKLNAKDYPNCCQFCGAKLQEKITDFKMLSANFAQHFAYDCEFFTKWRLTLKSLDCAKDE
jgi:hypothetical protein